MSVQGKFFGATRDDLLKVADRFGIGTAGKVLDQVFDTVAAWPDFAIQAEVHPQEIVRIANHHKTI